LKLPYLTNGLFRGSIESDDGRAELERGAVNAAHSAGRTFGLITYDTQSAPNQPKNVSFSLRKMEERTAEITTERAPRGVWKRRD